MCLVVISRSKAGHNPNPNFGIMWAYIAFNWLATVEPYWAVRGPKERNKGERKVSEVDETGRRSIMDALWKYFA